MELLHFGGAGRPLLAFPTSMGRFYQWEDFGLIGAVADWIDSGVLQVICVDSIDDESWYARGLPPAQRIARHLQYETYILEEVLPRLPGPPVAAGASFGALHAVLLALRHPTRMGGFVAMSGAFDTARWLDGYHDDSTYFTNPIAFLPGLNDEAYLGRCARCRPRLWRQARATRTSPTRSSSAISSGRRASTSGWISGPAGRTIGLTGRT